jgi:DEAD/DEAH box helicase domain-containing protein
VTSPEIYSERPALPASVVDRPPDFVGAIGAVKPTDVMVMELNRLRRGQGYGTLAVDGQNGGSLPAMWSFSELLRTAGALELDIDPRELEVGLQPYALPDGTGSRRVFIADRLENGAGYAYRLGRPDVLERVLDRIVDEIGPGLELDPHASECDSACPQCLRNYDNRRLHPVLDWRLGLDVAELAADRSLRLGRWLEQSGRVAESFADAFGAEPLKIASLHAVQDPLTRRIAILGHPLWPSDRDGWVDAQRDAVHEIAGDANVRMSDVYTAVRWPERIATWLARSAY